MNKSQRKVKKKNNCEDDESYSFEDDDYNIDEDSESGFDEEELDIDEISIKGKNKKKKIKKKTCFIQEESEILKLHELCKKKKKNLENQKQLLKNQLYFEKKKTSLLEYKLQNSQKKISDDLEYLNDLSIDNKKKFNSKSKSENNIKQKKINKKEKINFQLLIKPILTELDESENKNIKNKYTKNKSVKEIKTLENDRKKYGLFNPKEFKILSQIIPNESFSRLSKSVSAENANFHGS